MHPYISKLIAEQRVADMRAAATAHRLARAAKASRAALPGRSARQVPTAPQGTARTAPLADFPADARLVVRRTAERPQSRPESRPQSRPHSLVRR